LAIVIRASLSASSLLRVSVFTVRLTLAMEIDLPPTVMLAPPPALPPPVPDGTASPMLGSRYFL
jgi:hypothetical protein